jgi:hypothetical protein
MRTILNSNTIADGVGNSVGYVQNELNLEVKWDSFFWKNGIHVEIQINNMKSNICLVK